ncbi:sodium:solute symporter [Sphingomonas alpina]|uniref:Sodium:solute symporter n=1 Tax=Sphingomonas alpina TaxID=653931 RepID=A0A7H0LME6_9SPHN|nr:sodium:solute symporter [Sphingomonas alpina]QNQ10849.1 sodium:solute symporter [Sphingomonas alpina]
MIAIIHAIGRWFAIGLLLLMHAAPAWAAEEASSVHGAPLPTLSSDKAPMVLVAVGGRPVVIQHGSAHILKADRSGWTVLDRRQLGPDPQITGSITDGHRTVLLLGGSAERRTDRAALLQLDGNALRGKLLPPLPVALSSAQGAIQGSALLMAGVADDGASRLLRLTLSDGSQGWVEQPAWPGNGTPTALVSQGAGIFLTLDNGRRQMRWTAKSGWQTRAPAPGPVIAGSGRPISQANMLYLLSEAQGSAGLYSYNMITDAWARLGHRQAGGVIATLPFGNGLLSAWQRGNRLDFATAELELKRRPLDLLDWAVIGLYMVAMLSVGFYFYRRSKHGSASEFFLGSRTIPFWAAGVSMFAVNTSSISYLAIPAKAFDTNWEYMMSKIVTVAGLIFVAIWVIPIFRRLNLVSVYNYLELRFHPAIRMLVSALSILMHVGGRMGIVLFLPALAIGTITGTNVALCILILGICTIIYTALGGMRAVVWTDFFQVIVLMGGAIFAIGFIVHSLGIMPIYETAMQFDKAHLVNVSFDFTQPTIWGFIILILFDTVLTFPKDQVLMQRALSTSSAKQASRSIWLFGAVLLPGGFIFYLMGTVLFAYYRANPGRLDPLLPIDAVFPAFIGTELPHGVTGMIIAGLFAAAMGSLSGTINSVATLLSVDFYEKFTKDPTSKKTVRFAEWMTVVIGLVGIGIAIILSTLDIHSLLDLTIELFGLLGGSCAGAYTLGMFTRRANWQGVAIGIVTASLVTLGAWALGLVHPYFYLAIAIVMSIVVGYAASLFFPPPQGSLEGLTIFARRDRNAANREAERSTSTS